MAVNSSKYFNINEGAVDTTDYLKGIEPKVFDESLSIMECTFMALMENETNWNKINSSIALNELNYLKENGEEIVYEASNVKEIINTIVKAVEKYFEKIMGLLSKAKAQIDKMIIGNSKFLKANEKYIKLGANNIPADAEYRGYDCRVGLSKIDSLDLEGDIYVDLLRIADSVMNAKKTSSSEAGELIKDMNEKAKKLRDDVVSKLTGGNSDSFNGPDFTMAILGGKKKDLFEGANARALFIAADMEHNKDYKQIIDKMSKSIKKIHNNYIGNLKKYESKLMTAPSDDQQYGISVVHAVANEFNRMNSFCISIIGAYSRVLTIDLNQNIQLAKKLIEYGKKASKAGEGTSEESTEESALFKGLELV